MKKWTIETLTELWISRGYSKKVAAKMAEIDYKNMNKELAHEDVQELIYG